VKPKRIQLRRTKGWRMPENTVKVDRSTKWGNPFIVEGDPALAVAMYRSSYADNLDFIYDAQLDLRGNNLACWCPLDAPCHADVLLEIANS
jgi:hypothetical protein